MKYVLFLSLLISGCAGLGLAYYDEVLITSGKFKNKTGVLIGDCDGFEYYRVRVENYAITCIRSWNMEKVK